MRVPGLRFGLHLVISKTNHNLRSGLSQLLEAIAVKIILRSGLYKIVPFPDYLEGSGCLDSG
jgi:hypothetical protein